MAKPARDAKGRILPGHSGNPAGLSGDAARARNEVRSILAKAGPHAARRLVELMDSANEKIALSASIEVVTRNVGKGAGDEAPAKDAPPRVLKVLSADGSVTEIRYGGEGNDGEFSQPDAG